MLLHGKSAVRAEMQLLHREMFEAAPSLTSQAPGSHFSEVRGNFLKRPGGPRLANTIPVSADIRLPYEPSIGRFVFASQSNKKIFAGAWFLIKNFDGVQVDLISLCNVQGDISPAISIKNGELVSGILSSSFTPASFAWKNQWVYLGIAAHLKSGSNADIRFYHKLPGQPMQSWAPINDGQIGITALGQMMVGNWSFSTIFKGRLGAPSAYTFEEDDFSDVVYPADLIEPNTGLTWYCDPLNGNDESDGTSPEKAWKTAAKINEESLSTGFLPANSYEEGDTLVINTAGEPLDLKGVALRISTRGLNVRAATGQEWIRVKSYQTLPNSSWQPTATPNVFSIAQTQAHIVVWEDDKFMNHPMGSSFAAVQAQLSSTPGSFWTDGTLLYLHPFGSTDPRTDGKRYERSYNFVEGGAVLLNAGNLNVQDIHAGKTCLATATANDPIGGLCMAFTAPPERAVVKHSFLYYGSKHNLAIAESSYGDDVLVEDVQCEQGSPYVAAGGQTVFVSFSHRPQDLKIVHRFRRCRSVKNAGVIGSSAGYMTLAFPVFYSHNLGNPGEPDQFDRFEFEDCDFGIGNIQGYGVKTVNLKRTRCGALSFNKVSVAEGCVFNAMNSCHPGATIIERNCIHLISGELRRNPVAGMMDIQGCTFDATQVTNIQGGVPQASLFTKEGEIQFLFRNNVVLMPPNVSNANVFSYFGGADSLQLNHNAYQLGTSVLHYLFQHGANGQNRNFVQWQALGYDLQGVQADSLGLDNLRPVPGSPLINAGQDIGPLSDYTGQLFQRRNDIGAYEAPTVTYDDWQVENFTPAEIQDPNISGPAASVGNDGLSNLLKYSVGLSAKDPGGPSLQLAVQTRTALPTLFDVVYERSRWRSDVAFLLEKSRDLTSWAPAVIIAEESLSQTADREVIRATVESPQKDMGFLKLKIVRLGTAP